MQRSSISRERVVSEIERLSYAGLDADTLKREAVRSLHRAVPFDGVCSYDIDPASGLIMRLFTDPADEERDRGYLEQIYFDEDADVLRSMARGRQPVLPLSELTGGHLEHSQLYREMLRPAGCQFQVRILCLAGGEPWGGLALYRDRSQPDFNAQEMKLLRRVAPHLAAGLKASMLHVQAAASSPDEQAGPGVLVLDDRGHVLHYTAVAEHWLSDLGDLGDRWRDGEGLPAAVWLSIGAVGRTLAHTDGTEGERAPVVRAQGRSGRWLSIHAARSLAAHGRSSETVIVIEPAHPREVSWLKTAQYGLSAREREVVELVLGGASTKQLADALCISEYTVQGHLSCIFEKVGARGRRALVKRLYLDSLGTSAAVR